MNRTPGWFLCAACALAGCANDFEPQSRVDTLRVLAVVPEPASGAPGQTSTLNLVIADGVSRADSDSGAPRALQVVWLGGCHNPPSRQFYGCYPVLNAIAAQLSPRVVDTPTEGVPAGVFGTGAQFALPVPENILSSAPQAASDAVHFGVSYAFFAVCAGEIRSLPGLTDRLPLECVDSQSGQSLGRRDFVSGYATLYSYDGVTNHNPVLDSVHFGGATLSSTACAEDSDCTGLVDTEAPGIDEVCGTRGICSPRVAACPSSGSCPGILLTPNVPQASAEPMPAGAHEILWASFYATSGSFETATQLINDRNSGFIADHGSYFHPPRAPGKPSTVWVTVSDERGGAAFRFFEVWTR